MGKRYITANQLLEDAFTLGFHILGSGFRPDLLLAVWRGGTPVAIAIQELLSHGGVEHLHYAIRTRHYQGIDNRYNEVEIEGLECALASATRHGREVNAILIVDDVHDTGLSIAAIINALERHFDNTSPNRPRPVIRVAMPYFKPSQNRTGRIPDYYLHSTDQWIVFPHELLGLSAKEISAKNMSVLDRLREEGKEGSDG